MTGLAPTGGVSNYIRSIDVKDALTGIPHFGRIRVAGVYDGIDLVFYSHAGELEYDFVVGPAPIRSRSTCLSKDSRPCGSRMGPATSC